MNENVFQQHPKLAFDEYELKAISAADLAEIEILCSYRPPDTRKTAKELLALVNQEYLNKNGINWGIYKDSKLIGTIGFYRGFENNEAEIGYVLLEQYRGQGITSKAVNLLARFAFEEMQITKVKAYTAKDNLASHRVLEKAKFKKVASDIAEDLKFELKMRDL